MTEKEFTDFATAIQKAITMISCYLGTFGGSEDNTISQLSYFLESTRRYLRSALVNLLPKKSNDSEQIGTCPMFSELTLQMTRLAKLAQRLPKLDPFNPAVPEVIIEADLSNAISSFKSAAKEFAILQAGRQE